MPPPQPHYICLPILDCFRIQNVCLVSRTSFPFYSASLIVTWGALSGGVETLLWRSRGDGFSVTLSSSISITSTCFFLPTGLLSLLDPVPFSLVPSCLARFEVDAATWTSPLAPLVGLILFLARCSGPVTRGHLFEPVTPLLGFLFLLDTDASTVER